MCSGAHERTHTHTHTHTHRSISQARNSVHLCFFTILCFVELSGVVVLHCTLCSFAHPPHPHIKRKGAECTGKTATTASHHSICHHPLSLTCYPLLLPQTLQTYRGWVVNCMSLFRSALKLTLLRPLATLTREAHTCVTVK